MFEKKAKHSDLLRYWERCDICHWNYKFFGKMETFTTDTNYIMTKIGMETDELSHQEHKSTGDSTQELAIELFSKLPKKLVQQLYELYKIDFELFEYDHRPYVKS